jgi:TetR/AcrR family transcriptional regulator, regulator of mycofactocin system
LSHCASPGEIRGTLCHMPAPSDTASPATGTTLGLRERNKLRTRAEIADATLRLAADRGLEHVTVEQIAAAADIAPRTFFRYFDSKEDALLADHPERLELLRDTLTSRPSSEGPLTAVRAAILDVAGDLEDHRDLMLCKVRLMEDNPSLRGRSLEMMGDLERMIAEALAARTGADLDTDFRPYVIAGAVCTAMRVAIDRWGAMGGTGDLTAMVAGALDLLDGGLDRSI